MRKPKQQKQIQDSSTNLRKKRGRKPKETINNITPVKTIKPIKIKDLKNKSIQKTRSTRKRKAKKFYDDSDCDDDIQIPIKKQCVYFEKNTYNYDDFFMDNDEDTLDCNQDDSLELPTQINKTILNSESNLSINEDTDSSDLTIVNSTDCSDNSYDELANAVSSILDTSSTTNIFQAIPELNLPTCSNDLLLNNDNINNHLLQLCSIYEILNNFKFELRLSTFRFEDFIASMQLNEFNSLFSEIHISLLKSLIKDDKINNIQISSTEYKDSINIHLYLIDSLTWPQILKLYLQSRSNGALLTYNLENSGDKIAKKILDDIYLIKNYSPLTNLKLKLDVLQYLCDLFLDTNTARNKILLAEQHKSFINDDNCRECWNFGDLLCCDNCSAAWHLACLRPPLQTIPENEWLCPICKLMNIDKVEKFRIRKKYLGLDRFCRKYWWLCDRIIISPIEQYDDTADESAEDDKELKKVYYYSTRKQFDELMNVLDSKFYEKSLVQKLNKFKDEINSGFDLIYQLTDDTLKMKNLGKNIQSWISNSLDNYYQDKNIEFDSKPFKMVTRYHSNKSANLNDAIYCWDSTAENDNQFLRRLPKSLLSSSIFEFKLGMEAKDFINLFTINSHFLSKNQHQEEKDKKRQLSYKFSLTPLSEFKWSGLVIGNHAILLHTLRKSILNLENSLHLSFLCSSWVINRDNWVTAVRSAINVKELALSLCILESSIKPVVFNSVWYDSLGYNYLERTTNADRDERKRIEKLEKKEQLEEIDMYSRLNSVKFSILTESSKNARLNLSKLKGEEYRITGINGWQWKSSTRKQHKLGKKILISKLDNLTEEDEHKVKNVDTINVMRELQLNINDDKRIFYPKHFDKESRPKLKLIEGLLEKRIKLKKALEIEKLENDKKTNDESINGNSDYSKESTDANDKIIEDSLNNTENNGKSNDDEINEVFYCVKPVYLYNVNQDNTINRNLIKRTAIVGQLPPFNRFTTRSGKKSIFVLQDSDLRKLSRGAGLKYVDGFNYTISKSNNYNWPFNLTPRPSFRTCWLFRNSTIECKDGIENIALSLRVLWHCLKWDEMLVKPLIEPKVENTENEVITTELIKRRDLAPYGLKSDYFVKKTITPLNEDENKADQTFRAKIDSIETTPKREGLRTRKRKSNIDEIVQTQDEKITEIWMSETNLELCQIKGFYEKIRKQCALKKIQNEKKIESQPVTINNQITPTKNLSKTQTIENAFENGFGLIRIKDGNTFKIPISSLEGKKQGDPISIKYLRSDGTQSDIKEAKILNIFRIDKNQSQTKHKLELVDLTEKKNNITNDMSANKIFTTKPLILKTSSNRKQCLAVGIPLSTLKQQPINNPPINKTVSIIKSPIPIQNLNVLDNNKINIPNNNLNIRQINPTKIIKITSIAPSNFINSSITSYTSTINSLPKQNSTINSQQGAVTNQQPASPVINQNTQSINSSNQQPLNQSLASHQLIKIKVSNNGRLENIELPSSYLQSGLPIKIKLPENLSIQDSASNFSYLTINRPTGNSSDSIKKLIRQPTVTSSQQNITSQPYLQQQQQFPNKLDQFNSSQQNICTQPLAEDYLNYQPEQQQMPIKSEPIEDQGYNLFDLDKQDIFSQPLTENYLNNQLEPVQTINYQSIPTTDNQTQQEPQFQNLQPVTSIQSNSFIPYSDPYQNQQLPIREKQQFIYNQQPQFQTLNNQYSYQSNLFNQQYNNQQFVYNSQFQPIQQISYSQSYYNQTNNYQTMTQQIQPINNQFIYQNNYNNLNNSLQYLNGVSKINGEEDLLSSITRKSILDEPPSFEPSCYQELTSVGAYYEI